jgi:hypothetical protein
MADDMKGSGGTWQSNWHYVDLPWFDEGGSVQDYPEFKNSDKNLDAAIEYLVQWLKGVKGYKDNFVYTTVMKHVKNEEDGKSLALRLLIHLIGDIH